MSKIRTSEKEPHYRGSFFIESKNDMADMFRLLSPRYDLLNHLFSLGSDFRWRRKSAKALNFKSGDKVLDFGAGTGDFGLAVRKQTEVEITALDLVPEMLEKMKQKAGNDADWLSLIVADGEDIPFSDDTFDGSVAGFVGRNLFDLRQGLSEIRRVLKPGGRLGFLEFCRPENSSMKVFSWLYFRLIVKPLGNLLVPKKLPAYRYLIDSIEAFHSAAQMRQLFQDVGFRDVHTVRFNLGTVALTVGTK
ncbi:MAG: ubiquinone/menaquinone biosynthesis methyltransferase [Candidatus Marinimicrobia bacterium]|nr:ubiquinone/menaquinone biosynthesis methyltransferase [Candidatus Neomarinimicrobiota bacterium]